MKLLRNKSDAERLAVSFSKLVEWYIICIGDKDVEAKVVWIYFLGRGSQVCYLLRLHEQEEIMWNLTLEMYSHILPNISLFTMSLRSKNTFSSV